MKSYLLLFFITVATLFSACEPKESGSSEEFNLEFEKITLDNGLDVVFHQDKSDPLVSVAIMYHVGSNREKPGRTGFAHLFEHMLFQESEHVPQDQFFKKIQDAGGTLNGGTWQDGTVYYEVVPKNALEMVLWMESDRMGYLLNTVTETAFDNQQEVVQNEKRQRVDNRPYGHTGYVIDKNIYPAGHPYNWQVIGELEDLQNATVEDVKEFYKKFYGPNNATLVIAGDFEGADAKTLVEKYFGEIARGEDVAPMEPQRVTLDQSVRLYHEDNFAQAPQLNMIWPTVEQFSKDAYALDFLGEILSSGKKSPMYKVLVADKKLTSSTRASNRSQEIAGVFRITLTANQGVNLDSLESGVYAAFDKFETDGITDKDVDRIKAGIETDFYNGISSVLGKSFQISSYNVFAKDPSFIKNDIANIQAVTKEDIQGVYDRYIKGKPFVLTSFVPKGQLDLAASNCVKATVVEEEIKENVEKQVAEKKETPEPTPSSFDRSIEPAKGPNPELTIPNQWEATLANGMMVFGIVQDELPLVQASLVIKGGQMQDDINKIGIANLMTDILREGTATKTPEELEEAIAMLGADISMFTSKEGITFTMSSLKRNFPATLDLFEEMLLTPRWDETQYKLMMTRNINSLKRSEGNPNYVAQKVYNKLLYGTDHILGNPSGGYVELIEDISMDDLKSFYEKNFSPSISSFHIVGDFTQEETLVVLKDLETKWAAKEVVFKEYEEPALPSKPSMYFVDFSDAKQSVINIGNLSIPRTHEDYYAATVMNYKLGGSFSGVVNLILREEKGFTYGARTGFRGSENTGVFTASSSVRTNTTFESVKIFKEEMEKYRNGISQDDLDFTKNALINSNARRFETLGALIGMLQTRSKYGFSADYIKEQEKVVSEMTLEKHKALAQKYLMPDQMSYFVAGDAKTQFEQFKDIGFDKVVLLDKKGDEVKEPILINK
jgi:zinc protease